MVINIIVIIIIIIIITIIIIILRVLTIIIIIIISSSSSSGSGSMLVCRLMVAYHLRLVCVRLDYVIISDWTCVINIVCTYAACLFIIRCMLIMVQFV